MEETRSDGIPPPERKGSRRTIVKAAIGGAIALPFAGYGIKRWLEDPNTSVPGETPTQPPLTTEPTKDPTKIPTESPTEVAVQKDPATSLEGEERTKEEFERNNLTEFYNFYKAQQEWKKTYGYMPFVMVKGEELYQVLADKTGTNGHLHENTVDTLTSEWNTEKDSTFEAADRKIDETQFTYDSGVVDTVKANFRNFARLFPQLALAAPYWIESGDGSYNGPKFPEPNKEMEGGLRITLPTPSGDGENFYVPLLHEAVHAFEDDWLSITDYLDKEKLTHLLERQSILTKEIIDTYFSLSWNEAKTFKHGDFLMPEKLSMEGVVRLENDFSLTGLVLPDITDEESGDPRIRYNRIVHSIGKTIKEINTQDTITKSEKEFLDKYDDTFKPHVKDVTDEVNHYLTGPIQRAGGGLLRSTDTKQDDSLLTRINLETQKERIKVLSSLSEQELQDDPFTVISQDLLTPPDIEVREEENNEDFRLEESAIDLTRSMELNEENAKDLSEQIAHMTRLVFSKKQRERLFPDLSAEFLLEKAKKPDTLVSINEGNFQMRLMIDNQSSFTFSGFFDGTNVHLSIGVNPNMKGEPLGDNTDLTDEERKELIRKYAVKPSELFFLPPDLSGDIKAYRPLGHKEITTESGKYTVFKNIEYTSKQGGINAVVSQWTEKK